MEYTPQFEEALRSLNPNITPDQVNMAYGQMKQQFPGASDQDIVDAAQGAYAVQTNADPATMSPGVRNQVNQYSQAQMAEQEAARSAQAVQQKQAELGQINNQISMSQQAVNALQERMRQQPAMIGEDTGTTPQDLVAAQNQVMAQRNPTAETIGHIIAALGGQGSTATYNQYLAGKRRDEQQQIQNVKDRMSAETHQLQFQKAKDEYVEMRRQINQKYKEDIDRNDPDSMVSQITRQMLLAQAESVPALKNIPGLDRMSAAQLQQYIPLAGKAAELAEKKVDNERKARESDAKIALENAKLGKVTAETEKIKSGESKPLDTKQASDIILKTQDDLTKQKDTLLGADEAMSNIEALKTLYSRTSTGPIVGSDTVMGARKILPGGGDVQEILNLERRLVAAGIKAFGSNPTEGERKYMEDIGRLSKMDPAERDAAMARFEAAIQARRKNAQDAIKTLEPVLQNAQRSMGTTPTQSNKKVMALSEVKRRAAENGWDLNEAINHLKSKGYEVQ